MATQKILSKTARLYTSRALIKFGNHKLGDHIGIFNMGSATECPSRKIGLCEVCKRGIKCYAYKAEQLYPGTVKAARENQKAYWKANSADQIAADFIGKVSRRKKETIYFRFNESGDFESQSDVTKLSLVADALETATGVITYGYTARRDLDFRGVKFLVKGSGHDKGNNGKTMVIDKNEEVPENFIECPGSCRYCNLCMVPIKVNIAFRKH